MINLQDVTKSLYGLLKGFSVIPVFNSRAPYATKVPYCVFNVTEVENHEYFSGESDSDLVVDVSIFDSVMHGQGYIRRIADTLIGKLHKTQPTIDGMMDGADIRMLPGGRGQVEFVGNNVYRQTMLFSLRGTSSS